MKPKKQTKGDRLNWPLRTEVKSITPEMLIGRLVTEEELSKRRCYETEKKVE